MRKKAQKSKSGKAPLTIPKLKRKVWKVFSVYIRQRDKGICYTCGRKFDPKEMDAGHYISRRINSTLFNEKNVHAQCTYCNRYLYGNMAKYAIHLQGQYGQGILKELDKEAQKTKQFTREELEKLYNKYKNGKT